MSVAGLKKQFYKASQLVSEKVGGAEGTKLDDDFREMEKKVDVTSKAVTEVLARTIEYLQPNPASRAKLTMLNTVSKIRGQVKSPGYPQSEGLLGECMIRHGKELGSESNFGEAAEWRGDIGTAMHSCTGVRDGTSLPELQNPLTCCLALGRGGWGAWGSPSAPCSATATGTLPSYICPFRANLVPPFYLPWGKAACDALLDAGESMRRLAEVKDSLDIEVKQNFIDPLQNLCDKDLKEIQHHLRKLESRRLDFDYKKKRQGKIPDEELRQAMEKFEESKEVSETSMHNLLETDIEQVSQLSALVDAQLDYHRQAVRILEELVEKLKRRVQEASSRPRREHKPREPLGLGEAEQSNGGFPCTPAPQITASSSFRSSDKPIRTPSRSMPPLDQPSCKALYDFEPENDGELGFHEGDIIALTNQIDENWYEGMLRGHEHPALPSCGHCPGQSAAHSRQAQPQGALFLLALPAVTGSFRLQAALPGAGQCTSSLLL
ncbi:hypothetical protein MC885_011405, partial [Smutsia gigantea]